MDTNTTAQLQHTKQKSAGRGKTYDMAYIAVFRPSPYSWRYPYWAESGEPSP